MIGIIGALPQHASKAEARLNGTTIIVHVEVGDAAVRHRNPTARSNHAAYTVCVAGKVSLDFHRGAGNCAVADDQIHIICRDKGSDVECIGVDQQFRIVQGKILDIARRPEHAAVGVHAVDAQIAYGVALPVEFSADIDSREVAIRR